MSSTHVAHAPHTPQQGKSRDKMTSADAAVPFTLPLFPPCISLPPQQPLPPQHVSDHGKLTVVLDMDETLIHSEMVHEICEPADENTFYLALGPSGIIKVVKRPFLMQFLVEASQRFELIVFTAGTEEYANAVLNQLDPTGTLFRHRLFRQHCTFTEMGFSKDLSILNRNLQRTVLVDNSAISFAAPQLDNGVLIPSFFNDPMDCALVRLRELLHFLTPLADVRQHLANLFQLRTLLMRPSHDEV